MPLILCRNYSLKGRGKKVGSSCRVTHLQMDNFNYLLTYTVKEV